MTPFFTTKGDTGDTGYLGKGRISKSSSRIEAVGSIDEASAALGMARALTSEPLLSSILLNVQKKLYVMMTELSADENSSDNFPKIEMNDIEWLEDQVIFIENTVDLPRDFILPGESTLSAALALARTIVRRAERRTVAFLSEKEIRKPIITAYLNRLSSLVFVMEIYAASFDATGIRLAKED